MGVTEFHSIRNLYAVLIACNLICLIARQVREKEWLPYAKITKSVSIQFNSFNVISFRCNEHSARVETHPVPI